MRGSILRRCRICRREGKNGLASCDHKEAVYVIAYRVGRKQKWQTIGPNKKDAERVLAQRLSEINNGTYYKPAEIIFNDFVDKWLDEYASPRIKASTLYKYKNAINRHIRPHLGDYYLSKITPDDIRRVISKLVKIRSPKTTNNILTILKTIFKYARRWGYIRISPTEDVDKYKVVQQEMDFLRPHEIVILLKHCREPFRTFVMTAIFTGMRKAELLGLQWGDIDWNSNSIHVKRSLKWEFKKGESEGINRWYFDTPKTKYSVRAVTMSPALRKTLEIYRITSKVNECDLVFTNEDNKPLDPDNIIKRDFHPALSFAGLRRVRFHDLRHTFTSLLIAQGENIKFIQSQLGHASIQTTMDRYGHLLPVDRVGVGTRLDALVFSTNDLGVENLKVKTSDPTLQSSQV